MILAGRSTNDAMAEWVAEQVHAARGRKPGKALVLGLTFKEDVPDLRNSKVADLIAALAAKGHEVTVHDPLADADDALHEYGVTLRNTALNSRYDLVLLAVSHREYLAMDTDQLRALVAEGCGVVLTTDSQYVRQGITEWMAGWLRRGWKTAGGDPVKNRDLWERLHAAASRHAVDWRWVKGHAGHPENERVDQLARAEALKFKEQAG